MPVGEVINLGTLVVTVIGAACPAMYGAVRLAIRAEVGPVRQEAERAARAATEAHQRIDALLTPPPR